MSNSKKGFTLIELLVVIAIIAILSSVVLASLNTARGKGSDAAIKSNLNGARAQAELVYDTLGSQYSSSTAAVVYSTCASSSGTLLADATMQKQIQAAKKVSQVDAQCVVSAKSYVIAIPLRTNDKISWCIDSEGVAKEITTKVFATTDTQCPAN